MRLPAPQWRPDAAAGPGLHHPRRIRRARNTGVRRPGGPRFRRARHRGERRRSASADPASADPASGEPNGRMTRRLWLIPLLRSSPARRTRRNRYAAIPVPPPPTDLPAGQHGDLNLALRGYSLRRRLARPGDIQRRRRPGARPRCPASSQTTAPRRSRASTASMTGTGAAARTAAAATRSPPCPSRCWGWRTQPGELLAAPRRAAEIYGGGYIALVLYADERRHDAEVHA